MIRLVAICLLVATGCQAGGGVCRRVASLDFERLPVVAYPDSMPTGVLAVIGDTQRTSWQECAIGREVNDAQQATLLAALVADAPSAIAHVGDMVFHGGQATHWQYFDWLFRDVREAAIPLLPVAGNHEYWGDNDDAREHFGARFPALQGDTWYSGTWDGVGLVWLDSNAGDLEGDGWTRQAAWFKSTLTDFNDDPAIRGVLVFLHHSPFTNSPIVDPDENVQKHFVPAFCDSPKTLAMVSGHAHGYERFPRGAAEGCGDRVRQFIVSAGGGGPRPDDLRSQAETGLEDAFVADTPRPFNYLLIAQTDTGLSIRVRGMGTHEPAVRDLETLDLPF